MKCSIGISQQVVVEISSLAGNTEKFKVNTENTEKFKVKFCVSFVTRKQTCVYQYLYITVLD